jgi:hypothetical protein
MRFAMSSAMIVVVVSLSVVAAPVTKWDLITTTKVSTMCGTMGGHCGGGHFVYAWVQASSCKSAILTIHAPALQLASESLVP